MGITLEKFRRIFKRSTAPAEPAKPEEITYNVREDEHGIYVTNQNNGQRFFQTRNGGWFLLSGPGSPFDEDATIAGKMAEYLSGIVKTAQEPPPED